MAVLATDPNGLTLWCSPGFTTLSGFDESELIGRKPGHVLQSDRTDRHTIATLSHQLAGRQAATEDILNTRKDGSDYWVRLEITPCLTPSGELAGFLGIQTDLSAERERERQQSEAFKSELLGTFSHEVRTPLNALCNLIDLMARNPERDAELIGFAAQASRSMRTLVDNVLDLARTASRGLECRPEPGSVQATVDSLVAILQGYQRSPDVQLVTHVEDDIPLVCFDQDLLLRTLLNLASNALKFTERGQVMVRVEQNRDTNGTDLEWLTFSVTDTGIGLSSRDQARLFRPFEHIGAAVAAPYRGSGLGLTLCRRMVQAMGGKIQVRSTLGQGSRFWFELRLPRAATLSTTPADTAAAAPAMADASEHEAGHRPQTRPLAIQGMRILVVDDNPLGLEVARRQLARVGASVTTASSGEQALGILSTPETFDAVLMDIQMPGLDGFETTRRLRLLPGCSHLPVLALTAAGTDLDRNQALDNPMTGVVSKPFGAEDLVRALHGFVRF